MMKSEARLLLLRLPAGCTCLQDQEAEEHDGVHAATQELAQV